MELKYQDLLSEKEQLEDEFDQYLKGNKTVKKLEKTF